MNTTASHVAPEDVMALLDGELSRSEALSASAHLEECAECSQTAQRLRAASRALATWTVPEVPNTIDHFIKEAAKNEDRIRSKPRFFTRASFWSWK
jgi:anti-sigma factor RsiW